MNDDTIAAVSTPPGTGGIAVIRMSGKESLHIADKFFKGRKKLKDADSHTVNFGHIVDPQNGNDVVDEVLVTVMKAPRTYTREDIVEINCHGSSAVVKKVLEIAIKNGARPAEPGEFTKRAFLNGRIDLSQAEAVIDLINSKTVESSKAALGQLEGKLSEKLKRARNKLIELLAHIEVTVDYPEHDVEQITGEMAHNEIINIIKELEMLVKDFDRGKILREGINIVIAGKPNAGKSSLLNVLSGENKAIVTDIPGTTRDLIEEYINIKGIPAKITDTAGIRQTEDIVEKIGVEKAINALNQADLVLIMIDAQQGFDEETKTIIRKNADKKTILLINKTDVVDNNKISDINQEVQSFLKSLNIKCIGIIEISARTGLGIDELEQKIYSLFMGGEIEQNQEVLLSNVRHKDLIDKARLSLKDAADAYLKGLTLDCIAIDIKNAAEFIGMITGESVSEDVLKEIFSRFCIGK